MSRKKLLFVMNNLNVGGAEKALISLLQTIDYSKYEVDLQLFQNKGAFLKQLPYDVNLLAEIDVFKYYDMPGKKALIQLLFAGKFKTLMNRILAHKVFVSGCNAAIQEQKLWHYISPSVSKNIEKYDVALAFLEKTPAYYIIDKVKASKKIAFVQNDYEMLGMDKDFDNPYFDQLNNIVTCSEECKKVLNRVFPDKKDKISVIENIVSPTLIHQFSLEETDEKFPHPITIVSVGRLENQKGYDLAVDALQIVRETGLHFHWIILGEGSLKKDLLRQIENGKLQDFITFVGIKENHYSYLRKADIFMQTSRFEGKSISIEEAKIMTMPILVTNFNTVKDQIEDKKTGLIAEMNPKSIAENLILLIKDRDLRYQLSINLKKEKLGTEQEIVKLYELIEGI